MVVRDRRPNEKQLWKCYTRTLRNCRLEEIGTHVSVTLSCPWDLISLTTWYFVSAASTREFFFSKITMKSWEISAKSTHYSIVYAILTTANASWHSHQGQRILPRLVNSVTPNQWRLQCRQANIYNWNWKVFLKRACTCRADQRTYKLGPSADLCTFLRLYWYCWMIGWLVNNDTERIF